MADAEKTGASALAEMTPNFGSKLQTAEGARPQARAAEPILSVILVVGEYRERSARALDSILRQNIIDQMEVLVMDCSSPDTPPLAGSDHLRVQLVRYPPEVLYTYVRVEGVRLARAPTVAFLEEHCLALPGWAEALVEAHQGPWTGIGGEVYNANPGAGMSDTVALFNFAPWTPPATRGETALLPGNNVSYKRDALLSYKKELQSLMRNETVLMWKLLRDGHRLFVEPKAKFAHRNEITWRSFARAHYIWNRCQAVTRTEAFNWSLGKKALYAAALSFLPLVRLAKLFLFLAQRRRSLLTRFLRGVPVLFIALVFAAFGQAMGLVLGMGDAEAQFSRFELNEARGEMLTEDVSDEVFAAETG